MEFKILEENDKRIKFEVQGVDHTFMNALEKQLWNEKGVVLAGYRIDHPLTGVPMMIVETDDVLLIAKKGDDQRVRDVVNRLKENDNLKHFTEMHTTVYRPWGRYTELETAGRYKIKKIIVNPGETLSLQLH